MRKLILKTRAKWLSPPLLGISLLLGAGIGLGGCAAAAVGAGGAIGGIAYTDRGAKGDVKGDVKTVNRQATAALHEMNIRITGSEVKEAGKERTIDAKSDKAEVSVKMTQATGNTTHVEVVAQESTLKWNKDYAKQVLASIINQG